MQNDIECPVAVTIDVIGGKWKPSILWHLRSGVKRFGELRRLAKGITQKMLMQQLRDLEAAGIVTREVVQELPPHVEYRLSEYGETLIPMLDLMTDWGREHKIRDELIQAEGR